MRVLSKRVVREALAEADVEGEAADFDYEDRGVFALRVSVVELAKFMASLGRVYEAKQARSGSLIGESDMVHPLDLADDLVVVRAGGRVAETVYTFPGVEVAR